MIDVVILAGGDSKGLAEDESLPKSLLPLKGKLMLDYILEALAACPKLGKKVLVGPKIVEEKRGEKVDFFVEGGDNIFDNVVLGLGVLPNSPRVLVVTSDIPLLTETALEDFLERCERQEAQFYYPIIAKETNERKYPGNKRTYVKLQEGTFTGGNIFLVDPLAVTQSAVLAKRIISLRKRPLKLAGILGWTFLFKLLLHFLTIRELEERVSTLFKVKAISIVTPYPEIGVDIDKPSDLSLLNYFS